MTRDEAGRTAGAGCAHFRPLSLGTMAILQELENPVLGAMLQGGAIGVDYTAFVIFLFIHSKAFSLAEIKALVDSGELEKAAFDWVDQMDVYTIAEGVDYFTDTQTRIQLLGAENAESNTEKKKPCKSKRLDALGSGDALSLQSDKSGS